MSRKRSNRNKRVQKALGPVGAAGGWTSLIREPYAGAWQNNEEISVGGILSYYAVYACITLISADIGKLRWRLEESKKNGTWEEATSPAFSPLLRRPNRYQNHIQFKEWWITSKLSRGNAYILKERDGRGVVIALYILDPMRVQPLVADDGSVYYQLAQDSLNNLETSVIVPASEIIHDRMNCLFHPLVGVPPIFASGLAASQGLKIQQDSNTFFANGARPGGLLVAPGAIGDDTAARLKKHWEENYSGKNAGRVAVLGDSLSFEPLKVTAVDSQLVEQLQLTAGIVCATYHVPGFKIGLGSLPAGQKVEDMNQIYYSDCLQSLIESMELCLDEGLALPSSYGISLDLDGLLRMDTATQFKTLGEGVKGSIMTPDEARRRVNLPPVEGGNAIYMQQQNYSLAALAKRDASPDPFAKSSDVAPPAPDDEPEPESSDDEVKGFLRDMMTTRMVAAE